MRVTPLTMVVLRWAERRDHAGRVCLTATHETGAPNSCRVPQAVPHTSVRPKRSGRAIHQRCLDRMTLRCSAAGIRWL
jgi:hypothetical protein